jgi:hypothetical protein
VAVAVALVGALLPVAPAAAKQRPPTYLVGEATRSINPDPDGSYAHQPVYLGGYGIGGGTPILQGRPATGILGPGVQVRALAVSDGHGGNFAIADIEAQGAFVATKDGPGGLLAIRQAVAKRTGGALDAEDVVVQTDHSHGGADLLGVWGGTPVEYRRYVDDQTVDAIVAAFTNARAGTLWYGTAPAADLLSNQFSYDASNQAMDSDVRVLQARDKHGTPFATLLNFSAHPTVLGSSNTKITGDWPTVANQLLEQRFGGSAMTVVGTLGRTQPGDRGCSDPTATTEDASNLCKLHDYAQRVVDRAAGAAANAKLVTGDPAVAARSYLITDPSNNALILGLEYGGTAAGVPLNRSDTPPWLTGNVLGTVTASARIGSVLLSSGPGEMYPQIPLRVRELAPGLQGYMTAGLANDQLGYLIYPYQAYPEPIRRSFFNQQGDEVSPIDNDNYFFNVSHTMGARVTCSLLRGAGEVFGKDTQYRDGDSECVPFANDAALPDGFDTGF